MRSELLHDLANVFRLESEALTQPYAYPRRELAAEQRKEADRLEATSRAIRYRAHCAEYDEGPKPAGDDRPSRAPTAAPPPITPLEDPFAS